MSMAAGRLIHDYENDARVFLIPVDRRKPPSLVTVRNDLKSMQNLVGGYLERVTTQMMPSLDCGCRMVMMVNEEGQARRLPVNRRASVLHPGGPIYGDVFLVGEGPVRDDEGDVDTDLVGLPERFSRWDGPGSPYPRSR